MAERLFSKLFLVFCEHPFMGSLSNFILNELLFASVKRSDGLLLDSVWDPGPVLPLAGPWTCVTTLGLPGPRQRDFREIFYATK